MTQQQFNEAKALESEHTKYQQHFKYAIAAMDEMSQNTDHNQLLAIIKEFKEKVNVLIEEDNEKYLEWLKCI